MNATTPLNGDGQAFWHTDMLSALGDVQLLSKVLSRLEQGRVLPVLLRQYLGLKGKLVCFNVDPAFNDAYRRRSSSVRATSPRRITIGLAGVSLPWHWVLINYYFCL